MVVEVDGTVFSEEGHKGFVAQGMGMYATAHQYHEIRDVYDTDAEVRSIFAEKSCSGDDFEGHFYTNTDEYTDKKGEMSCRHSRKAIVRHSHIWVNTPVNAGKLPDGGTSNTMLQKD